MGLTDRAMKALRSVFGREREERDSADSPSTYAALQKTQSGVLTDSRYGQFSGLLSVSNRLIDRYLDYECLTGDTLILTLSGPRTIKSLAEESQKDSSFRISLYTWDGEKVTVGHGSDARLVKRAKTYRVLLDDGIVIRATGNHKFMRRDGSYAETLDLSPGDSLMPLYLSTDHYGNTCYSENNEYHKGALTKADKYRKRRTARMVAEWLTGERLAPGLRVTHIGDRNDDSPENIKINDAPGLSTMKMGSLLKALQEADQIIKENCIAEGQMVLRKEGSIVTPTPIEAIAGEIGGSIIGFDEEESALKTVEPIAPRLTGRAVEVYKAPLSNGLSLRLTPDHRCLTVSRGYVAFDELEAGDKLQGMPPNYPLTSTSILTSPRAGEVVVLEKPTPDGKSRVYDVTTTTKNLVVAGAVVHNSMLTFPPLRPWKNHKVVDIIELDEEDVYCLDVPGTHNYAVGNEEGGVFVHNSMDEYPDINTANHYFANDATQPNIDNDKTIWVDSPDHVVKGVANTLIKKKLRLDDDMFSIAYSLVKYGNNFEELLVTDNGVVGLNYLPPATVRRVEHENGSLVGFVQDSTGAFSDDMGQLRTMLGGDKAVPKGLALFEDWQVLHMRLRSTHRRSPYGYANCDGARWIWKRLVMLEDASMIYKLTRAPSRFAFYIDVTDQPSRKINSIMRQAKSQLKKRQIVDPRSGQLNLQTNLLASDEDFFLPVRDGKELARVENLQGPEYQCLTGDTKIPLLNGSEMTIKEMAELGEEQWVYSCTEEGEFKPGLARSPRMTSERERVWEVTLDNGEVVRCTWNHPFLTRDGRWVKAKDLSQGESLMPLNRRISSRKEHSDRLNGYEMLYNPIEGKFRCTHQLVYDAVNEDKGWVKGTVIHHEDGKLNNCPECLTRMTRRAHILHHEECVKQLHTDEVKAKAAAARRTPEFRESLRRAWEDKARREAHTRMMRKRMSSDKAKTRHNEYLQEWNKSEENSARLRREGNPRWRNVVTIQDLKSLVEKHGVRTMRGLMKADKLSQKVIERVLRENDMTWSQFAVANIPGYVAKGRAKSKRSAAYMNHTVVSVVETNDYEAVYDLTVEGTHCFGLSAGIFVHNSMEPVEYFQRKLHGVLKVPREYLGQEGSIPGRAILSNEDVRAARVTLNIQKELRGQVEKIIRVDAAARSVSDPWKLNFEVRMTMPSGIYALAQFEVKNSQADFASRVEPYVSKDWIRRNVFRLSDDEIKAIEKGAEKDMQDQGGFGADIETDLTNLLTENFPEKLRGIIPTKQEINKMLDHMRREEDKRRRVSDKRHDQLLEKMDHVMRTNAAFADRVMNRVDFARLVKDNGITKNRNGTNGTVPSARGFRINGATR